MFLRNEEGVLPDAEGAGNRAILVELASSRFSFRFDIDNTVAVLE
jgi:hypothetical protein